MHEITRNGKTYVLIDGVEFEFDSAVKVYIDSKTGSWVVNTNLTAESVLDVLVEAQDHFETLVESEPDVGDDDEGGLPDSVRIFPVKGTTGYN